jgi:MYXO-CTERM domain-containing protein
MLKTRLLIGASLLTLCALANATASTAFAQDRDVVAPTSVDRDDDGFDAGWLGLVGLAGLAGRNRNLAQHATARENVAAHR